MHGGNAREGLYPVAGNRGTGVEIKQSNAQDLFNESLF